MQTAWDELVYGNDMPVRPALTPLNWHEWYAAVLELLGPHEHATEILEGKAKIAPPPSCEATLDNDLFLFLVKGLDKEALSVAMDVKARYGLSGKRLYRILRAHYDLGDTEENVASTTSAAENTASGAGTNGPASIAAREEERYEDGDDSVDDDQDGTSTQMTGSEKRKMYESNSTLVEAERSFQGIRAWMLENPWEIFPSTEWPLWSVKLVYRFTGHQRAIAILKGIIDEGHREYSSRMDEYLFDVVRAHCCLEHCGGLIQEVRSQFGGSKVYAALKEKAQSDKREEFALKFKTALRESSTVIDLYNRMSYMRESMKDHQIVLHQQEMDSYSTDIARRFPKASSETRLAVIVGQLQYFDLTYYDHIMQDL